MTLWSGEIIAINGEPFDIQANNGQPLGFVGGEIVTIRFTGHLWSNDQGHSVFAGWIELDQLTGIEQRSQRVASHSETTYLVMPGSDLVLQGSTKWVSAPPPPPPPQYNLIVNGGTGSGSYIAGARVSIVIQESPGRSFRGFEPALPDADGGEAPGSIRFVGRWGSTLFFMYHMPAHDHTINVVFTSLSIGPPPPRPTRYYMGNTDFITNLANGQQGKRIKSSKALL